MSFIDFFVYALVMAFMGEVLEVQIFIDEKSFYSFFLIIAISMVIYDLVRFIAIKTHKKLIERL